MLIVGATFFVGLNSYHHMRQRVRILTDFLSALHTIQGEICDRLTSMPELMHKLESTAPPPLDKFFGRVQTGMEHLGDSSFWQIWQSALDKSTELRLTDSEASLIRDLGRTLGQYDTTQQKAALDTACRMLERYRLGAMEQLQKQGKLHAALGLMTGAFMVILLI